MKNDGTTDQDRRLDRDVFTLFLPGVPLSFGEAQKMLRLPPREGMKHLLPMRKHMLSRALPRGGSHAASHIRNSSPVLKLKASNGVNTCAEDR